MGVEPICLLVMSQPTDHWYEHPAIIIISFNSLLPMIKYHVEKKCYGRSCPNYSWVVDIRRVLRI